MPIFFLSGFSFKDTGDSQNSRGRVGIIFITPYHFHQLTNIQTFITAWKVSKYGVFCGPYFLVFGLNAEIYEVKNSLLGHFSRSVFAILHVRSLSHILIELFVTIRLLLNEIYQLLEWPFDWLDWWYKRESQFMLTWSFRFRLTYSDLTREISGIELASTIILVLQSNKLNKCTANLRTLYSKNLDALSRSTFRTHSNI